MTSHYGISAVLRQIEEQAAKEQDPEKLRQFVLAINILLDVIERRVTELERKNN